jgi:hypothetical protein
MEGADGYFDAMGTIGNSWAVEIAPMAHALPLGHVGGSTSGQLVCMVHYFALVLSTLSSPVPPAVRKSVDMVVGWRIGRVCCAKFSSNWT